MSVHYVAWDWEWEGMRPGIGLLEWNGNSHKIRNGNGREWILVYGSEMECKKAIPGHLYQLDTFTSSNSCIIVVSWRARDSSTRNYWPVRRSLIREDVIRDSVSARREVGDSFRTYAGKTVSTCRISVWALHLQRVFPPIFLHSLYWLVISRPLPQATFTSMTTAICFYKFTLGFLVTVILHS